MITPAFTIEVKDTKLQVHLQKLPLALKTNLTKTIAALTDQLLVRVRAAEPVRTGLLRSQTRRYVDTGEDWVRGRVRILATGRASRVGAAFGALEYGVKRQSVAVSAYQRQGIAVRAYDRIAHITERRFLRGSLAAMRTQVITELEAAVAKSVEESAA
jgi:hypothetical protein